MFITSCDENKTIYVAPALADCVSEGKQNCLQIRENKEDEWTLFYDEIEGFDYKEGFTYKIEVNISKLKNSPADGPTIKYKLVNLIYQEPAGQVAEAIQSLSGKWIVANIMSLDSLAAQPTLEFTEGKVSGNAGCNKYSADYTTEGNSISIGLAMATKMYCTNMNIEKAFFNCLQKAATYKISTGQLIIYDENNKELFSSNVISD